MEKPNFPALQNRCAGVLLHITSLPSAESHWGNSRQPPGTLGVEAFNFVDFMNASGLRVWQMLPVVPTDNSPYQALSVHAGNPELISLDDLVNRGWAKAEDIAAGERPDAESARRKCSISFYKLIQSANDTKVLFSRFIDENNYWLQDFSLFKALRSEFNNAIWTQWPEAIRSRQAEAMEDYRNKLKADIDLILFEQFVFFTQWNALKAYANNHDIKLFGDMPIFVGHDSADVWAQPHYFRLDKDFNPITVAGVPPDTFSETGQCWGNPHYAWEVMQADGFKWWLSRIKTQLALFDIIRIDHFRAFEDFWEIPGTSCDAREGKWVKAPGDALLTACMAAYPETPLVAENLGTITKEVEQLRNKFNLPGMIVLQFAFDGKPENIYLPQNHKAHNVIYTGTHDNDTTVGWYAGLDAEAKNAVQHYGENYQSNIPWLLIEMAFASIAHVAIIPMQDFLELDGNSRMNMPGSEKGNWAWQFSWQQLEPSLSSNIFALLQKHKRA